MKGPVGFLMNYSNEFKEKSVKEYFAGCNEGFINRWISFHCIDDIFDNILRHELAVDCKIESILNKPRQLLESDILNAPDLYHVFNEYRRDVLSEDVLYAVVKADPRIITRFKPKHSTEDLWVFALSCEDLNNKIPEEFSLDPSFWMKSLESNIGKNIIRNIQPGIQTQELVNALFCKQDGDLMLVRQDLRTPEILAAKLERYLFLPAGMSDQEARSAMSVIVDRTPDKKLYKSTGIAKEDMTTEKLFGLAEEMIGFKNQKDYYLVFELLRREDPMSVVSLVKSPKGAEVLKEAFGTRFALQHAPDHASHARKSWLSDEMGI